MKVENVVSGPEGLAAENGKTGTVVWKIASPYPFVGGHLETEAAGGPGGGLSARRRPGRGHGLRFPLERAEGSRRRQDHRLPLHARQPARHEVAAVDELRQVDFADGGQGQGAIHLARHWFVDG